MDRHDVERTLSAIVNGTSAGWKETSPSLWTDGKMTIDIEHCLVTVPGPPKAEVQLRAELCREIGIRLKIARSNEQKE